MTEIRDYFPHLDALDVPALHARRDELLTTPSHFQDNAIGDYSKLLDEPLAELLAVSRALRKKAAIGTKRKSAKASKEPATLDSLA